MADLHVRLEKVFLNVEAVIISPEAVAYVHVVLALVKHSIEKDKTRQIYFKTISI